MRSSKKPPSDESGELAPTVIFDLHAARAAREAREDRDTMVQTTMPARRPSAPQRPVTLAPVQHTAQPQHLAPPPAQHAPKGNSTFLISVFGVMFTALVGVGLFLLHASHRLDERIRVFESLEQEARAARDAARLETAKAEAAATPAPAPDPIPLQGPIPEELTLKIEPMPETIAVPSPGSGVWVRSQAAIGSEVQEGSVLGYRLSAKDYRALLEARRTYEKVQANAKRDALSKMFLSKARSALASIEQRYDPVRAPAAGTLVSLSAAPGDDLSKFGGLASISVNAR